MKAAELRIGNWVNLYGDDCRIQTVGMWVHTDTTVDEAPIESVKPIPLTEEWLLKFGFEQNYAGYEHPSYRESGRWITRKFILSEEKLDTPFLRFDGMVDVYFVHQLQNLYFALTGTELTLNQKDNHDQRPEG